MGLIVKHRIYRCAHDRVVELVHGTALRTSMIPLPHHFLSCFIVAPGIPLTLLEPRSRFGTKLLEFRLVCPHIWDCGSKRVNPFRTAVTFWGTNHSDFMWFVPKTGRAVIKGLIWTWYCYFLCFVLDLGYSWYFFRYMISVHVLQ